MAINKLDTGAIQDNAITNAKMADDAVGVADLAATGTPSSTTFLRGDNAWATPTDTDTNTTYSVQDGELSQNNFTNDDHTKLNNIEASATADQTNDEIKAAVEAASDSNTFTDADHTKLNAIEASADVTDATNVAAAGAVMTQYVHPNHSGDVVSAADGAMTIQTDAVDIAMLSATGTPGSTTFLRGDNSWATAGVSTLAALTDTTVSSSLPAVTTNPSAVGAVWVRETTGNVYVCTDITSNANVWKNVGPGTGDVEPFAGITATGGTITTDGDYKVHKFTSSGTFQVTAMNGGSVVEYLLVAGGGGGGQGQLAGGGGGGGLLAATGFTVSAQSYSIVVGAGGSFNYSGSNSTGFGLTAVGGGAGAESSYGAGAGNNGTGGGSGGGSSSHSPVGTHTGGSGTGGQGNAGGDTHVTSGQNGHVGGGGGGAGGVGEDSDNAGQEPNSGDGGIGVQNDITGTNTYYAGGGGGMNFYEKGGDGGSGGAGGGCSYAGGGPSAAGADGGFASMADSDSGTTCKGGSGGNNTGGGGGASHGGSGVTNQTGAGGSGVFIVRYQFQ